MIFRICAGVVIGCALFAGEVSGQQPSSQDSREEFSNLMEDVRRDQNNFCLNDLSGWRFCKSALFDVFGSEQDVELYSIRYEGEWETGENFVLSANCNPADRSLWLGELLPVLRTPS